MNTMHQEKKKIGPLLAWHRARQVLFLMLGMALHAGLYAQQGADDLFQAGQFGKALTAYLSSGQKSPLTDYRIGICYLKSANNKTDAREYLERAALARENGDQSVPVDVFFHLGVMYHYVHEFTKAINLGFTRFREYADTTTAVHAPLAQQSQWLIKYCEFGEFLTTYRKLKNVRLSLPPFPFNTSYNEYTAAISGDGQTLVFSSDRNPKPMAIQVLDNRQFADEGAVPFPTGAYVAYRNTTQDTMAWSFPERIPFKARHVEALALSGDGQNLLVLFGNSPTQKALGISTRKGDTWQEPVRLPNTIQRPNTQIGGGCFAMGGTQLIFSSNRPGGFGGFDLYVSQREASGKWGEPVNMGKNINTPHDEVSPFMLASNKTLFFSSSGHNSMGYLDIFKSTLAGNGEWGNAENLGVPINSPYNDDRYIQPTHGGYAFFSSDRNFIGGVGSTNQANYGLYNIFQVDFTQKALPFTMVRGQLNIIDNGKVEPASLRIYRYGSEWEVPFVYGPDLSTRQYAAILPTYGDYQAEIWLKGQKISTMQFTIPEGTYEYTFDLELALQTHTLQGKPVFRTVKATYLKQDTKHYRQAVSENQGRFIAFDALERIIELAVQYQKVEDLEALQQLTPDLFDYETPSDRLEPDAYYNRLFDYIALAVEKSDPQYLEALASVVAKKEDILLIPDNDDPGSPFFQFGVKLQAGGEGIDASSLNDLVACAELCKKMPAVSITLGGITEAGKKQAAQSVLFDFFTDKGVPSASIQFKTPEALTDRAGANDLLVSLYKRNQ
jgi:hypothetical protein